jgi:hypothetical protein
VSLEELDERKHHLVILDVAHVVVALITAVLFQELYALSVEHDALLHPIDVVLGGFNLFDLHIHLLFFLLALKALLLGSVRQ